MTHKQLIFLGNHANGVVALRGYLACLSALFSWLESVEIYFPTDR